MPVRRAVETQPVIRTGLSVQLRARVRHADRSLKRVDPPTIEAFAREVDGALGSVVVLPRVADHAGRVGLQTGVARPTEAIPLLMGCRPLVEELQRALVGALDS